MTEMLAALPGPLLIAIIAVGLTAESGFLIGVAIPGTAITLAGGVAAHAGMISLPTAVLGAALGAVGGGQLAYQLGHRRRHSSAPFAGVTRLPSRLWPPLHRSMRRRPVLTVLAAQWLASGRVLVPRAAGWSQMGRRRFTTTHTPSALAWAATLPATGYAATAATRDHLALALSVAAGAAVLLGLTVLLRRGPRRTPAEPQPATLPGAPSPTLSRVPAPHLGRRDPRRLLATATSALVAALVVAGCGSGPDKTLSDDATVPGGIAQLTVSTAGGIHIEPAAPGAPVSVHRDVRYRADTPPASITRREGDALILDGTCGDDCLVDYRVRVPRGTPVDARAQAGAVDASGVGTSQLRSDAGPITAADVTGDLTALTQAGVVDATNISGATVTRSQAGAVTVTRSGGPVDASSQAGPVTVGLSRPADVTARSDASDITVTLPPSRYRIDARDIDQPEIAVPSRPDASHAVTAQTDAGHVRIAGP